LGGYESLGWEYLMLSAVDNDRMNELGVEGWELVAIAGDTYRFKRPRLSFKEQVTLDQKRRYYALWGIGDAGADEVTR
jgi:hypothetical protein